MTEKQQIANYIKIMKIMGKFGKYTRLYGQYDRENNIVYIRVLGGEPFLSKNLYDILLRMKEMNDYE